ncbi:deoxyribonuclease IV [Fundidesulfovibrio agrisoli]|uniref:deoxyribonuclease IV n=1 Tax=Fundidesulfovibrio agrisoli TaxID=2922717 RepID=UPI001FACAFA4|nr:deoxyribonuclease IV [Fundidesulfovibrio agrisoli]
MSATGFVRRIGAHESIAGGLHTAFERIASVGGTALQIFTRNQRQWDAAPVSDEEAALFAQAWERWGSYPVASHASYLINVASPDDALRKRSVAALAAELERCRRLGVSWVVLHPGARGGSPVEEAMARAAASLDQAFEGGGEDGPLILLENTAGQGSALGGDLAELAAIAGLSRHPSRIGFCFDTCHGFAAGYDVRSAEGLDAALSHLDTARLLLLHVNDSKGGLGSHLDRHEHIGQGAIGPEGFSAIVNHPRLAGLPMILETHKEKDLSEDVRNLAALRALLAENRPLG